jgi:type IV pilus assembly protein PilY1
MDRTLTVPQRGLRAMLAPLGLSLGLMLAMQPAVAGPTELADIPLANSTTANILPNIMLDLDNSGSMAFTYMPDYVRFMSTQSFSQMCRGPNNDNTLVVCEPGDPPFYASGFNSLYYNPAIRYVWPVDADGSRRPDHKGNTAYASPWSAVPSDGYGIQDIEDSSGEAPGTSPCRPTVAGGSCTNLSKTAVVNLATAYPERVWCRNASDVPPSPNCKSALDGGTAYLYPNGTYREMKRVYGAPFYYNVSVEWCRNADNAPYQNFGRAGTCQAKKTATYNKVRYYNWSRVDIKPSTTFPAKAPSRTDCAGASCTYAEEMANFATWYAWYRTRTQMTRSAIGQAFSDVRGTPVSSDPNDASYLHARVGLTTINNPIVLNVANFDSAQKTSFYNHLYTFNPVGGTPLRNSLDSIGRMYKGTSTTYSDPVQYACQKNFAILATDGYWNDSFTGLGDVDGVAGVSRPSLDGSKTPNTLADVAYHYYHTDLRTSCTTSDVCTNNVPPSGVNAATDDTAQHQHMTTFTIGLGVDGTLTYDPAYKTSTSGDYFNIKQGPANWPVPASNAQETIDDLWHAAVNGRGTYFSTKDPSALEDGLRRALSSIDSATGSGAAAATSNLQPTTGDNYIYVATYRTLKWDGEVSAYTVDLSSGAISGAATWQAEPLLRAKIGAAGNTDTRVIYTANGNTRTKFATGTDGLTAAQLALFDTSKLSQYAGWSASQKSAASSASLVNYLRGQDRYEDQERDLSYGSYERLYRDREKVLGDIVHAQPIYVKAPPYDFTDDGYAAFKSSNAARAATLYVAANDGMLHAFDGATGQERWAFVPPQLLGNLWRLADANYANDHRFYLDGPLAMSDAKISGTWKTVLVGALGKGGRGYYALDVTDPADPKPLWDFTADDNANVGYTYGTPFITKLANGTWVAVVTSGYNNVPEGSKYGAADGRGYVFVLNLADGSVLKTISTGVGSIGNPSGLARLNVKTPEFSTNNTAVAAYGGDLTGVMWRFDLDAGTATKLADFGPGKPIMAAPEIAEVEGKRAVYFGTGRYLGQGDLDDAGTQTLYGIKDDGSTVVTSNSQLVGQTATGSEATRSISGNAVDWSSKFGWYVDLPDTGERVTLDPQLYFGTLVFATTVPSISACQPGGYSWLYQLNFATGGNVKTNTPGGLKFTSPVVGVTVSKLPSGTPIIHPVTADGKKPNAIELQITPDASGVGVKRVLWRELSK